MYMVVHVLAHTHMHTRIHTRTHTLSFTRAHILILIHRLREQEGGKGESRNEQTAFLAPPFH